MRQILVNHARKSSGGEAGRGKTIAISDALAATEARGLDVVALDQALKKLSEIDVRQSRIVELRFFGGLKEEEIASLLEVSIATVKRDWRLAQGLCCINISTRAFWMPHGRCDCNDRRKVAPRQGTGPDYLGSRPFRNKTLVDHLCANDPELRAVVQMLLDSENSLRDSVLEAPLGFSDGWDIDKDSESRPGRLPRRQLSDPP